MSKGSLRKIKSRILAQEEENLAASAISSSQTRGRDRSEPPHLFRTPFQVDRDRIIHSPSFRRLKFKTQVFIEPLRDDTRTRLTHTLEVMQISRTVARALALNEDLTEAIALGHDLGHTPFAHIGESVLDEQSPAGFHHSNQSVRIVETLEKEGRGLNLTGEVRDGIAAHSKSSRSICDPVNSDVSISEEALVVRLCDSIAYLNHDIEDAIKLGVLDKKDLPEDLLRKLGHKSGERISRSVASIIKASSSCGELRMDPQIRKATDDLRDFLFENLYLAKSDSPINNEARRVMSELYKFFRENQQLIYQELPFLEKIEADQPVVDFLSLQSDLSIVRLYRKYIGLDLEHLPAYE